MNSFKIYFKDFRNGESPISLPSSLLRNFTIYYTYKKCSILEHVKYEIGQFKKNHLHSILNILKKFIFIKQNIYNDCTSKKKLYE